MIDPSLCFSAKNEIIKIAMAIALAFVATEEYTSEADLYKHISEALSDIEQSCSSDTREGYTRMIATKYSLWISDEAYKQIRIREMKSTLNKMRAVAQ
jgi:hypothetical protein